MQTNPQVTEVSMAARITLRTAQYRKFCALKGWKTLDAQATQIGVNPATVSRILNGQTAPGELFIAGVLSAMPELDFADLFAITGGDNGTEVAA